MDTLEREPIGECSQIFSMATLAGLLVADAERRHNSHLAGTLLGPVPPFPQFAEAIGGFFEPGTHILHAAPGLGKTSLALQFATSSQTPALFVSCETTVLRVCWRLIAQATSTYVSRLRSGELAPSTVAELFKRTAATCPNLYLMDGIGETVSVEGLARQAELIRTATDSGHVLLVVDSVSAWAPRLYPNATEYEAVSAACESLDVLGKTSGLAIVGIAERNREAMQRRGQHSGAGSRKLEYKAETVMGLDIDEDDDSMRVLEISKNRNGEPCKINLKFNGPRMLFTEVPK